MADLSPAAQAVLDAVVPYPIHESAIAAALRAAADRIWVVKWAGQIQPDATHMLGINWSRDAFYAIAAELDAQ